MKRILSIAVFVFVAAAFAPLACQSASCKLGVQAPPIGFWTWAPASKVKVYVVVEQFEASELPFLLAPLSTWNAVAETTSTKVKFEYAGSVTTPRYCQNCLTIVRGPVFNKSERHLTELKAYSAASNQILTWASIVIDPRLTNQEALANAMAHELGHSFGLLDCYTCKKKTSVMVQFDALNVPNEMNGPTGCDVAQVKHVYEAVTARLKRSTQLKPIVVDEGEEPADDDTPIVVPKP